MNYCILCGEVLKDPHVEVSLCDKCGSILETENNNTNGGKFLFDPPRIVGLKTSKYPSDNPLFGVYGIETDTKI